MPHFRKNKAAMAKLLVLAACALLSLLIVAGPMAGQALAVKDANEMHDDMRAKPWKGDFNAMAKRRIIRVLTTFSKTHYFLDGASQRGIVYETMKEFEKYLNKKLKKRHLKVMIVIIPVSRDKLLSDLDKGLADLAVANLTITPERSKLVDFSTPAGKGIKELVVTGPKAPALKSLKDLSGKEVVVRKSSSYYHSLLELNKKLKKDGFKPVQITMANEMLESEDILEMVNAGLYPITIMDSHIAKFWKQVFKDIKVYENLAVREGGGIGWAFRKKSPQLKSMVNGFLKKHKAGTLFGNIILKRYLKSTKYVDDALGKKNIKRFNQTIKLFRKYSDQYGFDWLMVTALAYQESHLDHSKRSPAGAVGIMQILPSTAAGDPINIPDIIKLDRNIHAGVKYLHFLYNTYFKDEKGVDQLDKVLFTFASYNAGPARVRQLRTKAKKMGLNPNKWFRNVEVAAARVIGRETVQYVSNIFKYYLAYVRYVKKSKQKKEVLKKAS